MPTWAFILLAIIFLAAAWTWNTYHSKRFKYHFVDRQIARYMSAAGLLAYPLGIKLDLEGKPRYEKMIEEGAGCRELFEAVRADAQAFLDEYAKPTDPRSLFHEPTEQESEYSRLMEERKHTPRAAIAAYMEIPWSRLTEREFDLGFYITDTESGHTWRVPYKSLFDFEHDWREGLRIHEIDKNRRPVTTHLVDVRRLQDDIRINGRYVTEIEKPNFFILGTPF
jgi:hypothetical protein